MAYLPPAGNHRILCRVFLGLLAMSITAVGTYAAAPSPTTRGVVQLAPLPEGQTVASAGQTVATPSAVPSPAQSPSPAPSPPPAPSAASTAQPSPAPRDGTHAIPFSIDMRPDLDRFIAPKPLTAPPVATNLDRSVRWEGTLKVWTAPNFFHRPLYFEQPNLERYGHRPRFAPLAAPLSMAHFFGTIPTLPYRMGQQPPCSRSYTLGYGRPGDCQLHQKLVRDPSLRGGLLEASAITGLVFLIP